MKKLGILIMPLMAISFLGSCGTKVSYTLTYTYDNGTDDKYVETYDKDKKTVKPTWAPENPGYTFDGWFTGSGGEGSLFTFGNTLTADTVVFAHWTSIVPTTYTVTFDAAEGTFNGASSLVFKVPANAKLLPYIKSSYRPTAENKIFAYYEYVEKSNAINYDDTVTSDITLKANYSDESKTSNLDSYSWKTLKNIAVTGDPSQWFENGATKSVVINDLTHKVRLIDFAHEGDITANGDQTGMVFEFANVITKEKGKAYITIWDGVRAKSGYNYDYRDSVLNDFLNDETPGKESIINMLPSDPINSDLREVIVPVDKKVGASINKDDQYEAVSFEKNKYPKLFPLAHKEIDVGYDGTIEGEGTRYAYYETTTKPRRTKKPVGSDSGFSYWLRSPSTYEEHNDYAWFSDTGGYIGCIEVYTDILSISVAPAFCI